MNPPLKTTGLFLTPRGPYGRRLPERARKHLRASEDEKPDPTSKGMQGLAGQMAPNPFVGSAGAEVSMDKNGVPLSLGSQQPKKLLPAPGRLSGQLPLPEQKPLVSPQDIASERWHADLKRKIEENKRNGFGGTGSMTRSEQNRYNSIFSGGEKERADGQLGDHVAVGGEYSKTFGLGEKGDLSGGIIVRTNTGVPFQPATTKEAVDELDERMYGPRADGVKSFNDFYQKKR
jgi:hypothetical protein